MADDNSRVFFNTRERLVSDDLNNAITLAYTKGTDEIASTQSGDDYNTITAISGMFAGGIPVANGVNLTLEITPMIGYKYGLPATDLDSRYQKVQSFQTIEVDLAPFVDGANNRWVAIEVAPSSSPQLIVPRDIFQPAVGTFTVQNVTKIIAPDPIVTVNAGVPAIPPQFPTGLPGVIPLAYVFLEAGTTFVSNEDIIVCRPRMDSAYLGPTTVQGGGLTVLNAGTTEAEVQSFRYRNFRQGRALVSFPGTILDFNLLGAPNYAIGESYPLLGDERPLYAYAITPPYPTGYDTDCTHTREFIDAGAILGTSRVPSNAGGNLTNGIVMLSTQPPNDSDEIGRFPGPVIEVNDATWNNGQADYSVYMGAVSKQDIVPAGLAQQVFKGKRVRFTETDKVPFDFINTLAGAPYPQPGLLTNRATLLLDNTLRGLAVVTPPAYEFDVVVRYTPTIAGGTDIAVNILGSQDINFATVGISSVFNYSNPNTDSTLDMSAYGVIRTNSAGEFDWGVDFSGGLGSLFSLQVGTAGYLDPVIGQR